MEKIHREAALWKYYFMKYNILVQSVHPILSVYIFTGSKTIFAKKWTTKPLGGGGKSLVVRPLKKHFFYVCLP